MSHKTFLLLFTLFVFFSCDREGNIHLHTAQATEISTSSAVLNGSVKVLDGEVLKQYGFVYSKSRKPTIFDDVIDLGSRSELGDFQSTLEDLENNTTYYYRSFGLVTEEVSYGDEVSFTTLQVSIPSLSIQPYRPVVDDSITIKVNISEDGGAGILSRGVCWGENENPTVSGNHTDEGSGDGIFYSKITGLECGKFYYVRAYASNEAGIAYSTPITLDMDDCAQAKPSVNTVSILSIGKTTATVSGNVTNEGSSSVTARGICWSTSPSPDINDEHSDEGGGSGDFSSSLSGLDCNTTYYVRAYATNGETTAYGDEKSFSTEDCSSNTVTDIDGNVYQTVQIGSQVWMAENLNVTHYPDGTPIPYIETDADWQALDYTDYGMCWFNNDDAMRAKYGALYTWNSAVYGSGAGGSNANPSGIQGVCPDGWHVPSDSEWRQLEMYLGMTQSEAEKTGQRGSDEGGKLKETGFEHWLSPNLGATNSTGFNGRGGGFRQANYLFVHFNQDGSFWSSTQVNANTVYYRDLYYDEAGIWRDPGRKHNGLSVRCVKD